MDISESGVTGSCELPSIGQEFNFLTVCHLFSPNLCLLVETIYLFLFNKVIDLLTFKVTFFQFVFFLIYFCYTFILFFFGAIFMGILNTWKAAGYDGAWG